MRLGDTLKNEGTPQGVTVSTEPEVAEPMTLVIAAFKGLSLIHI